MPVVSSVQNAELKIAIVMAALMKVASVIETANATKTVGCVGSATVKKIMLIRKVGRPRMNK